jgi:hypothetical protein
MWCFSGGIPQAMAFGIEGSTENGITVFKKIYTPWITAAATTTTTTTTATAAAAAATYLK